MLKNFSPTDDFVMIYILGGIMLLLAIMLFLAINYYKDKERTYKLQSDADSGKEAAATDDNPLKETSP